jgi:hypothetical protein
MAGSIAVRSEGFREFRRDVRRADKEVGRELQKDLREVAQGVAREAATLAPRDTGKTAAGYRGSARGTSGVVRNAQLPARFIEFGFHPRGGSTFVEGRNPIGTAVERREDAIVEGLGDAVDRAVTALGWR